MIHQIGGLVLLAIAVIAGGRLLGGEVARTWDARWPGTRPSRQQAIRWGASRARSAGRSGASWGRARLARSRLAEWIPARARGTGEPEPGAEDGDDAPQPPGAPDPADPPRPGPPRRSPRVVQGSVVAGDDRPAPASDAPAPRPHPAPGPPAQGDDGAPQQQSPTGRNPMTTTAATAVPGAEEMAAGMARLRAHAVAGNINAKKHALAALAEVFAEHAATVAALARSMQENSMYGPEITEPVAEMAAALSALSTRAAEAESQVASLAATPVGEVPGSRHQAPARAEMSEAGGR